MAPDLKQYPAYQSSRPYTRWWWLHGPFRQQDIVYQLDWLNANGFGGVELAWLDPTWQTRPDAPPRPEWLGEEWSALLGFTKRYADEIGLGCDFTLGSCWPFGGSRVRPEDAAQTLDGASPQRLYGSWESGPRPVLNHLSADALRRYADALAPAFAPGLAGTPSALFCDSGELDAGRLWSPELWDAFEARYGYRLEGRIELARTQPHMRYEYRRMVGATMQQAFFETFADICHQLGAFARVQAHGTPTDLLSAYASADVPETESLLFPPPFSRIAASAAALAGKDLVSAEAFSCIYGIVGLGDLRAARYWRREQPADLKLLADALLAHGVNQFVWHGMPFNPPGGKNEFYTSVHVGPDAAFASELPAFNEYLETVCGMMRRGRPYANLAVYLPNEDMLLRDRVPDDQRTPGAMFEWEMRQVAPPPETAGYHPLWISEPFLREGIGVDGDLVVGNVRFSALYLNVEWLASGALEQVARLAAEGVRIVLVREPKLPGMRRNAQYAGWLAALAAAPNVRASLAAFDVQPLMQGASVPPYWAREGQGELLLFLANPLAAQVRYPMLYGQSLSESAIDCPVTITYGGVSHEVALRFEPYRSIMLRVTRDGQATVLDLDYVPPPPVPDEQMSSEQKRG